MANPFLMTDDDIVDMAPATNDVVFNPFLAQDAEGDANFTDNPFLGGATNPFAGFGDDSAAVPTSTAPETGTTHSDAAMSFFGTTIQEDDLSVSEQKLPNPLANFDDPVSGYSSEDELARKKIPPRPLPPSQTTQDLIFAVADQLDQASSQMLGRLPKTRSPSPVSMRDIHSPSPTPDAALGDFLDCSDQPTQPTASTSMFGQDLMATSGENPFAMSPAPVMETTQPVVKQPPRPPPPRPVPPRPTPPVMVPPAAVQTVIAPPHPVQQAPSTAVQNQEPDLFDMFDAAPSAPPKPPPPKSKEDILSLFNTPKPQAQPQQAQPDLLSGDILGDIPANDFALPPLNEPIIPPTSRGSVSATDATELFSSPGNGPFATAAEPILTNNPIFPVSDAQPTISEPEREAALEDGLDLSLQNNVDEHSDIVTDSQLIEEPQKLVMDSITPDAAWKRAPTPDIEITTVESLPRSDDEEEQLEKDFDSSVEMEETKSVIGDESDQSHALESSATTQALQGSPPESNIVESVMDHEQMDTGLDFAPSIPSGSASANPFASPETEDVYPSIPAQQVTNVFAVEEPVMQPSPFAEPFAVPTTTVPHPATPMPNIFDVDDGLAGTVTRSDEFDAFSAKFETATKDVALLEGFGGTTPTTTGDVWGSGDAFGSLVTTETSGGEGFGGEDEFDSFLSMKAPEKQIDRKDSADSINDDKEFNVVIRPKGEIAQSQGQILVPPPPPRSSQSNSIYSGDSSPRFNPFDKGDEVASAEGIPAIPEPAAMQRTDSQETPTTPLFDDDVSQPLEDFPRINYTGSGWEMQLRQPNKKKITGQRFWKKIFVKIVSQGDNAVAQLFNQATDKEPFQELPLQPCYSVSEIGAQQYDQFGKIFTVKLQYIFYKERPGVRPGQVTKAERLTNKLSQFAAYAIQGDYQGVKEFGSDLKKLGLPVEHAPQVSQLFKIGSMSYEDMKQFSVCVEEALFKLPAHRDRALNYKSEEVQITAVDELYVEQDAEGHVHKQIARVRLFFLGFLSGMPWIELGVNDLWRQGKEVVGRHDIIPVVTEEWIRLEGVEFHNTVQLDEYERSRIIKFQPPDACYIELMRFRVRPPKNRELPLQVKATWVVTGNRVELRADVLVPGFASRKLGQIPCEDVSIRFPIPECWIYLFRVEKHFRYGSVKSAHRRTGKIKGIERILGTVDTLQESLIEVTSGQAKYEHHHRAIVWRCPRLPKEGQGAYTTHQMVCRMALTSYDQIPEQLAPYCYVEFTMPATQVSHTTVRSVSVQDSESDEPPEKYVRYLARHEYRVGIEHTTGESENPYLSATRTTTIKEEAPPPPAATSPMAPSDSDSESN